MFERWFGRKESPEAMSVPGVTFRCEHDGVPERELKNGLIQLFERRADVEKAFLAVVTYPGDAENGVALCTTGVKPQDRPQLAADIGTVFAKLFRAEQHLDLIFPTSEQESSLGKVCRPFFVRSRPIER